MNRMDNALALLSLCAHKTDQITDIRMLLAALGNPQQHFASVQVAGTNGKGSTSAMIASVLRQCGVCTGLFTSPYLERIEERIRINGRCISQRDLRRCLHATLDAVKHTGQSYTQFQILTAVACLYFYQSQVDGAVMEAGIGGKQDATTFALWPRVCVLTPIGMDHMTLLGNTLEEIAAEKAGIAKSGVPLILAPQAKPVEQIVAAVCDQVGAPLRRVDSSKLILMEQTLKGIRFNYCGETYRLSLIGEHQMHNAACAIETIKVLREMGMDLPERGLALGLRNTKWPARLEVFPGNPTVLLDGAHNPHGAAALAKAIHALMPGRRILILSGILTDKSPELIAKAFSSFTDLAVATQPNVERAMDAEIWAKHLKQAGMKVITVANPFAALETALSLCRSDDVLVICGSLYLAGQLRKKLRSKM